MSMPAELVAPLKSINSKPIFENYNYMQINIASPGKILELSHGEVERAETINYRTLKPEKRGLFCEQIFGPQKNYECYCGKYKRIRYKGLVCDRCNVEITSSSVRRERMGHIKLAVPVSHIWYVKSIPCKMSSLLDISPKELERVLYFASYIVTDPKDSGLAYKQVLSEKEYRDAESAYGGRFEAMMGAEAILKILCSTDFKKTLEELRSETSSCKGQRKIRIMKRLDVINSFLMSGNKPEWTILTVLPVMPPELRPMVQLDGGRFATSDLNDLYRRVINRNNRLKKLLALGAPDIIVKNEKRMLQEAVDALIDNSRRDKPVTGSANRPLKSISDMLKGKHGRFRQNLLGKRVDYSGRSVIVVGPELKMHECGLPKEMAIELFKPHVISVLVRKGSAHNIKSAKKMVERPKNNEIWNVLEEVIKDHPVLLNRAPTLHRLGIQAFQPILVEGRSIKLHPLVCSAYNADFDGDQMAVHIPLSPEAQAEARFFMLSINNLLKPQNGKSVATPTKDIVLGCYYLTEIIEDAKGHGKYFMSPTEAKLAYENDIISLRAPIKVRIEKMINNKIERRLIDCSVGRLIFNERIPQDLGFVDRTAPESEFELEINFIVNNKKLSKIIDNSIQIHGMNETAKLLDHIKEQGFKYATRSGTTISMNDIIISDKKEDLINKAEEKVEVLRTQYNTGLLTSNEMYVQIINIWSETTSEIKQVTFDDTPDTNPVKMMIISGARGSISQLNQLAGIRGLMASTTGDAVEVPIKSNFCEGLGVYEFFNSAHGARKGLTDVALRTADSGYLTRRLVDVSQDVIINQNDCNTNDGIIIRDLKDGIEIIEYMEERLIGRNPCEDVIDPATGEILVAKNQLIHEKHIKKIIDCGIKEVKVRSSLRCRSKIGVCATCYGQNLTTAEKAEIGEAVGIIAAQSIGEPGTQLTMRTFHTGGVAGSDITQGLPRIEELFEARKPKGVAIISEISGNIKITEDNKKKEVSVTNEKTKETINYVIPYGSRLKLRTSSKIEAGEEITEGSIDPHDILRIRGRSYTEEYLIREVQRVYKLQGVEINDKHVEVIIRQMMKKVRIEDGGDSDLISGSVKDLSEVEEINKKLSEENKKNASCSEILMGITKASLATESFLSAASFQETTKVLTDAAIKGKIDPLLGLKENVILGKLIPAGTGHPLYNQIKVYPDKEAMNHVEKTKNFLYGNEEDF